MYLADNLPTSQSACVKSAIHLYVYTNGCYYALVIGFPEEGGPRADVGEYGDFVGILQQISALVVGEMWGLRFCPTLGENVGTSLLFNGKEIGNDRLFARSMMARQSG